MAKPENFTIHVTSSSPFRGAWFVASSRRFHGSILPSSCRWSFTVRQEIFSVARNGMGTRGRSIRGGCHGCSFRYVFLSFLPFHRNPLYIISATNFYFQINSMYTKQKPRYWFCPSSVTAKRSYIWHRRYSGAGHFCTYTIYFFIHR